MANIEELTENITHKKVFDLVKRLKFKAGLEKAPHSISGYCASDIKKFNALSNYIAREIGVQQKDIHSFNLQAEGVTERLLTLYKNPGEEVFMAKIAGFLSGDRGIIEPHRFDQILCGLASRNDNKHKIIIVTHLDNRDKDYEYAVGLALNSQFKSFFFEL